MAKHIAAPRQWNSTLPRRKKGLQRTGFPRSAFAAPTSSTPKSKDTQSNGKKSSKNGSLSPRGKKTREWESVRAKLKVRFERAGITTCEVRAEGCWRDDGLGFMHTLKRRNIVTPQQLEEVALGCNHCHDIFELMPEAIMGDRIRAIISNRLKPVEKIFD